MSYEVFKSSLRLFAQINTLTLMSNTWIISPPKTANPHVPRTLVGSTLRSFAYSTSEPLYYLLFIRIPAEPSYIFFMTAAIHTMLAFFFWVIATDNAGLKSFGVPEKAQHQVAPEKQEGNADASSPTSMLDLDRKLTYPLICTQIQMAAASNAGLMLAARNFDIKSIEYRWVHVILLIAGLCYMFLARLPDIFLARQMCLPSYLGQDRAATTLISQAANLLLILVLSGVVRWIGGIAFFPWAWTIDGTDVEKFAGVARFLDWIKKAPRWLSPTMLVFSLGLAYLSGRNHANARMEQREFE